MEPNHTAPKTLTETTLSPRRASEGAYEVEVKFCSGVSGTSGSRALTTMPSGKETGALFLKTVTCFIDKCEMRASSTSKHVRRHSLLGIKQQTLRTYST